MGRHYNIPIFVPHQGCPHDCIFCNQKKISGQKEKVDGETVRRTIDEYIQSFTDKQAIIEVAFFGGSFTGIDQGIQEELLDAAYPYVQQGLVQGIRISTRPDYISEEILQFLKEYGVTTIELGVQSMDAEVLKASRRGHSSEDVIRAVHLIKEFGFCLGLQMMVGLPGDTGYKSYATAESIVSLRPDFVRIYPTLVIKDTDLAYDYTGGKYRPLTLDEAVEICKDLVLLFERHHIDIIRIGLQATENISSNGDVVAGPFHPSFGELVESEIYRGILDGVLNQYSVLPEKILLRIPQKLVSRVVGNKRRNISYLKNKYGIDIKIQVTSSEAGKSIILEVHGQCRELSKSMFYPGE